MTVLFCLFFPLALVAADTKTPPAKLTAAQIVEKNVAARGGLQAWRAVQSMSWTGKMDAGGGDSTARSRDFVMGKRHHPTKTELMGKKNAEKDEANKQVQLPFVMEMKRPRKSRVEIEFAGKTAIQVYDGSSGWKLRPFLNRNEVEPFTAEELKSEAAKSDLDGPLVDYAAKGTKVELEGSEPVEGRNAYKLKLTMKSGTVQHVWIDAENFLDVKVEGTPRRMDGKMHNVSIYQREFRPVQGVMIPFILETAVDGYPSTHKMIIEKAVVNPKLDDTVFAKIRQ
ncbi:MAG: outer membrane lipoprotein-sorting protein [Acidobacteria bacterium]|nr:MAG: outer membrane lipoprotein-sorting protein [Acidobacteriota bacterium]PYY05022.1 MAG: outer membrane lipoprotein-sorting protein [Acidobacteriota bacterium]